MFWRLLKYGIFAVIIFWGLPCPGQAEEPGGQITALKLAEQIAISQQSLEKKLTDIEKRLDKLAKPVWEYKIILPNVMSSRNQGDTLIDGINFKSLGRNGWELVNYSAQYGFVFKRRMR